MRFASFALVLGVALAGCQQEAVPNGKNAEAAPDPTEAKINKLPEQLQRVAFFRAIQDAGYTCDQIVTVKSEPRANGRPVWTAKCDDDGVYVIALQPGGVFNVSGVPRPKPAS